MPKEFEDLNEPLDDFGMPPSEGMPDPTAESELLADAEPVSEEIEEAEEPPVARREHGGGLMAILARADLYTVMLAISLAAVLIAVLFLMMEWGNYSFERKPKVSVVAPVSEHVVCLDRSVDTRSRDHIVG